MKNIIIHQAYTLRNYGDSSLIPTSLDVLSEKPIDVRQWVVHITKGQIESLIEFIDLNFIPSIRNDENIDNMDYICNICDIYRNLIKAQETIWNNEEKLYNDKVGEQNE